MTNRKPLAAVSFALLVAALCVVIGAWICAALGRNVQNLLSAEGLRWLFVHALDDDFRVLSAGLLFLLALGSVRRWWVPAVSFVVFLPFLLLPSAPLLSATGDFWPSPFVVGIVPAWSVCVVLISLFHNPQRIARFLPWMVPLVQGLFLFNLIRFTLTS